MVQPSEHKDGSNATTHDFARLVQQTETGEIASLLVEPIEGTSSCVVGYVVRDASVDDPIRARENGQMELAYTGFDLVDPAVHPNPYSVALSARERDESGAPTELIVRPGPEASLDAVWTPSEVMRLDCERRARAFVHGFLERNELDGSMRVAFDAHVPVAQDGQPSFRQWINAMDVLEHMTQVLPGLDEVSADRQALARQRAGQDIVAGLLPEYNAWLAGRTYALAILEVHLQGDQLVSQELERREGYYGLDMALRELPHGVHAHAQSLGVASDEAPHHDEAPDETQHAVFERDALGA